MNREGGCCIANYHGGGGGGERMYGMSKVDRIMLKFRPIAPKPVVPGSGSGGSTTDNGNGYVKCARSKRKYVRVNKSKNDSFKRRNGEKTKAKASSVVTLPLLPETPDRKDSKQVTSPSDLLSLTTKSDNNNNNNSNNNSNSNNSFNNNSNSNSSNKKLAGEPLWLCFNNQEQDSVQTLVMKPKPAPRVPLVVSYVTVECVTDTWVDWEMLGCTDEEIVKNMDKDTCPGFISDGQDKVVWTNKSYRDMAGVGHVVGEDDIAVVLVRKDKWTRSPVTYPAFTCKVRVTFGCHNYRQSLSSCSHTLTMPCDVWRMGHGSCAWRLDVKAALSLGR